jgi:prepilin-type N-terminal cleavage/methylation domain-containing protein
MPTPTLSNRASRGFTLLELLIVISILMLAMLVFFTFMGRTLAGPSIERHVASIKGMTTALRQSASVRQVHAELVFDYRRDQVIALSRRRLSSFSFDSAAGGSGWMVGSGGVIGTVNGATVQDERNRVLIDGDALELGERGDQFTIPWAEQFESQGDYEGIAMSFDFCPIEPATPGTLVRMGNVLTLSVVEARANAVRLGLVCGGINAEAATWIATHRWATVEIAVSSYGVSLYVDGRLSDGRLTEGFKPPPARNTDVTLGGVACRIDNFELMGLIAGQILELEGTHLIARGVDPLLESTMQAEHIYESPKAAKGPVTGPGANEEPVPMKGLPDVPPPGIVHIYFDGSGKLDPARHPGAVDVFLVSGDSAELKRVKLTFHPLGAVTSEVVEAFDWELVESGEPQ